MLDVVSLSQVCFAIFLMVKNIEQRICLKFCIANGISCAESLKMLQKAYGESTLSKTRAYGCYSSFKSGRDVVEDLPRSGRPSTSSTGDNIAKMKEIVIKNRHLSLREIDAELSVSRINSYHFKRLFGHETRCCSTSSERPFHKAIIVNEFLAKTSANIIEQPPYSPDMAPADFFLFPKLKLPLRGTRFQSIEDITENSRRELKSIPENAFKKFFDDWIIRCHKCIISGGAYFENDKIKGIAG